MVLSLEVVDMQLGFWGQGLGFLAQENFFWDKSSQTPYSNYMQSTGVSVSLVWIFHVPTDMRRILRHGT